MLCKVVLNLNVEVYSELRLDATTAVKSQVSTDCCERAGSSAFDFGCFFRLLFLLLVRRLLGQYAGAVAEGEFGLEQLGADFGCVHEGERADYPFAQFASVNDGVEHAVFEEELGGLKIFRELLPYGLLDDARPGESDERL